MSDVPPTPRRSESLDIVTMVVASLNNVITALREEIVALGENEKAGRRRISMYLTLLGLVAFISVFGVVRNYQQGSNVQSVVHYISDCQRPESECKKRNDAIIAQAVTGISTAAFNSITCVLRTVPEERTDAIVEECRARYLGAKK